MTWLLIVGIVAFLGVAYYAYIERKEANRLHAAIEAHYAGYHLPYGVPDAVFDTYNKELWQTIGK